MAQGRTVSVITPFVLLTFTAHLLLPTFRTSTVLAQLPCNRTDDNFTRILNCSSSVPSPRCDESGNVIGCECYQDKITNRTKINCRRANFTSVPRIVSNEVWDDLDFGMTPITSIEADSFSGVNVKHINFFLCTELKAIKANAFRGASYVDFLEITRTGLEVVEDYAFNGAGEMRIINMMSNNITNITRWAFVGMPFLNTTRLDYNYINYIHPNAFSVLDRLLTLSMSNNKIKTLQDGILDSLSSLEDLTLANNEIEEIPKEIFKNLKNLKKLNLGNNKIHSLSDGSFNGLGNLQELDIGRNNLSSLPGDLLKDLSSLEKLELMDNYITSIPNNIFRNQPKLWFLNMARNKLKDVPWAIKQLKGLLQVDLAFNKMEQIPPFSFYGLNLKRINLGTHKTAMNITDQSFCGVNKSLQFLDLSFSKKLHLTGACSFNDIFDEDLGGSHKPIDLWNSTVVCNCNFRELQIATNCTKSTGDNLDGCRINSFNKFHPSCSHGKSVMQQPEGFWSSIGCTNYTMNCTSVCDREEEPTTVGQPTTELTTASNSTGEVSTTTKSSGGVNGAGDSPDNSLQVAAIVSGSIGATIVIVFIICCVVYLLKKRIEASTQRPTIVYNSELYDMNGSNQSDPIINNEFHHYGTSPRKISAESKSWQMEADEHFENKPHSPYCNTNSQFPWPFDTTKT